MTLKVKRFRIIKIIVKELKNLGNSLKFLSQKVPIISKEELQNFINIKKSD